MTAANPFSYSEILPLSVRLALLLGIATGTAILGVIAGVFYSTGRGRARVAVPLSAGLLLGVALFGLLPELALEISWLVSVIFFAAGFLLLSALDRLGMRICPDCSHDHEHHACAAPLHGFAVPVLAAAGLHALFDGWAIAASSVTASSGIRIALPLALVLHKLPEGLALGGILKAAVPSRWNALALAAGAECLTLAGGAVSIRYAPTLGSLWTSYPLALAGGFFLFLGFHALHGEWKNGHGRSALAPGLTGFTVAALLQTGLRSWLGV